MVRARAGSTAPLRFPCFSIPQRIASWSTAARSAPDVWLRRAASFSRSALSSAPIVTRSDHSDPETA